jgi:hypothetical protein
MVHHPQTPTPAPGSDSSETSTCRRHCHHHCSRRRPPSASMEVAAGWRMGLVGHRHRRRGASCLVKPWRRLSSLKKGFSFFACDQLWRRETTGLGLNVEYRPMQLHANSIR